MLTKIFSSALFGIEATTITIEVNVSQGINFYLVGLPDSAVKESQQRIKAAFKNNNLKYPGKEITVNMAPADIRKEGSIYDLPIAIGILVASEQIRLNETDKILMLGELSLDGTIQAMKGSLPIALKARDDGFKKIILPIQNAKEAAVVKNIDVIGVSHIKEVLDYLNNSENIKATSVDIQLEFENKYSENNDDFLDVKGQENIKRAFEVAASGGHNVILIGPPGSGKSMLAKRLSTILPPMTLEEALETTKIHSVAGKTVNERGLVTQRPFRKPHHTISDVALVGGGSYPQPGEISLAHNGVLFLDELPEYKRQVLEVMRQPLEDRTVSISRAKFSVDYPAAIMLVAAMNPCPCGYFNHPEKECTCSSNIVQKYLNRVSGPLLDRIDLHIEVTPVGFHELAYDKPKESSIDIRKRVIEARKIQENRYINETNIHCNAQMDSRLIQKYCEISESGRVILKAAMDKLGLSARAYDRILKVARTIADLESENEIQVSHLAEAIQYRSLDKSNWTI